MEWSIVALDAHWLFPSPPDTLHLPSRDIIGLISCSLTLALVFPLPCIWSFPTPAKEGTRWFIHKIFSTAWASFMRFSVLSNDSALISCSWTHWLTVTQFDSEVSTSCAVKTFPKSKLSERQPQRENQAKICAFDTCHGSTWNQPTSAWNQWRGCCLGKDRKYFPLHWHSIHRNKNRKKTTGFYPSWLPERKYSSWLYKYI